LAEGAGSNEPQTRAPRGSEACADRPGKKMTKAPSEIESPKQISKAEREARRAFRQVDAATAMSEYEIAQAAFSKNRERLKAERLAREATATPPTKAKSKAKKK